ACWPSGGRLLGETAQQAPARCDRNLAHRARGSARVCDFRSATTSRGAEVTRSRRVETPPRRVPTRVDTVRRARCIIPFLPVAFAEASLTAVRHTGQPASTITCISARLYQLVGAINLTHHHGQRERVPLCAGR